MKLDRFVIACCGILLPLLIGLPVHRAQAQTQTQTWEVYTYSPVANAPVRGLQRIIDAMQSASGGSLTMKLHMGGSLQINATTITQSVADGVIQLGDDIFFTGSIPMSGVARLPMLIRDPAEFAKVAPIIDKYMIPAYAKKGVVALGQYIYPLQTAWSRRELTRPAQFQGLKMRVTSPEQGEVLRLYGGSSVTMQPSEVPAAVDRGVIDGAFTASSGSGYSWRDLIHYNYRLGLNFVNSYIIVNKDAFDALSPALQEKLRAVVAETLVWNADQMRADEIELTQKIAAGGVNVVQPTPEDVADVQAKIAPYWDQWAKAHGPDAIAALHEIRTTLGR